MKKMILTAVMLAAAALCRAQQPAETGERRDWLTSFTAVEVSAPLDVNFVHETRYGQQLVVCCEYGTDRDRFEIRFEDGTAACKAAIRWETSDERSNQTA